MHIDLKLHGNYTHTRVVKSAMPAVLLASSRASAPDAVALPGPPPPPVAGTASMLSGAAVVACRRTWELCNPRRLNEMPTGERANPLDGGVIALLLVDLSMVRTAARP